MVDIKLNDTVELTPEWKEYFKEMRKKNPKIQKFCSFQRGVVMEIKENEIIDFPRIITVTHDNGNTYQYQEHHLQLCEEETDNDVVIEYVGNRPDIEKKGNIKIITFTTKIIMIRANGKEYNLSFDKEGNMNIMKI